MGPKIRDPTTYGRPPLFRELLTRLKNGEELAPLLPEFATAMRSQKGYVQPTADQLWQAVVDNEFDISDGWSEVETALVIGDITPEQYEAICGACGVAV